MVSRSGLSRVRCRGRKGGCGQQHVWDEDNSKLFLQYQAPHLWGLADRDRGPEEGGGKGEGVGGQVGVEQCQTMVPAWDDPCQSQEKCRILTLLGLRCVDLQISQIIPPQLKQFLGWSSYGSASLFRDPDSRTQTPLASMDFSQLLWTSMNIYQLISTSTNFNQLLSTSANICQPQSTSVNLSQFSKPQSISVKLSQLWWI